MYLVLCYTKENCANNISLICIRVKGNHIMIHQVLDIKISDTCTGKKSTITPKLYAYVPSNSEEMDISKKRKTILICPGGGYEMTSDREAEPIALRLLSEGFNAFVLRYSVAPASFPTALCEVTTAVAMIREHSEEWNVDVDHIIVGGFSAGGHLAGSLGTLWHTEFLQQQTDLSREQYKPNGIMLSYPVITSDKHAHQGSFKNLLQGDDTYAELVSLEKNVTEHMPQTFIWHTYDDAAVPVENSLLLATAMKKYNIPLELHIYPSGVHGLSLANEETAKRENDNLVNHRCQSWIQLFVEWMKYNI